MAASKRNSQRRSRRKPPTDGLELGTDKLYFKIGEVAEIVGVEPYVLRYWETEFRALRPQKSRSKQRVYRRKDVETVLKIKHLLYDRRFTIAGARQEFEKGRDKIEAALPAQGYRARQSLAPVREQIDALWAVLREDDEATLGAADPAEYIRKLGRGEARLGPSDDVGSLADRPEREAL